MKNIIIEILENIILSGIGESNGEIIIVNDFLSDYENTPHYKTLKEKTDSFLVLCNEKFNTDQWEEFMDKDFETEIFPIL